MKPLTILICGTDESAMQRAARALSDDGVKVKTYRPFDLLVSKAQGGDFLLIDLDGLNRFFLRSLLPIVRDTLPKMPIIGISAKSSYSPLDNELKLDAYFNRVPAPEDLIVLTSQVTAKYLVDTGTLRAIGSPPRL